MTADHATAPRQDTRAKAAQHLDSMADTMRRHPELALACRKGADALREMQRLTARNAAAESDLAEAQERIASLDRQLNRVLMFSIALFGRLNRKGARVAELERAIRRLIDTRDASWGEYHNAFLDAEATLAGGGDRA